eukprot:g4360.t1
MDTHLSWDAQPWIKEQLEAERKMTAATEAQATPAGTQQSTAPNALAADAISTPLAETETVHRGDNTASIGQGDHGDQIHQGGTPEHLGKASETRLNDSSGDEGSSKGRKGKLSQPGEREEDAKSKGKRRAATTRNRERLNVQFGPAFCVPSTQQRVFDQLSLNGVGSYKTLLQLAGAAVIIAYIVSKYRSH